jgi:hypothetical protein
MDHGLLNEGTRLRGVLYPYGIIGVCDEFIVFFLIFFEEIDIDTRLQ